MRKKRMELYKSAKSLTEKGLEETTLKEMVKAAAHEGKSAAQLLDTNVKINKISIKFQNIIDSESGFSELSVEEMLFVLSAARDLTKAKKIGGIVMPVFGEGAPLSLDKIIAISENYALEEMDESYRKKRGKWKKLASRIGNSRSKQEAFTHLAYFYAHNNDRYTKKLIKTGITIGEKKHNLVNDLEEMNLDSYIKMVNYLLLFLEAQKEGFKIVMRR